VENNKIIKEIREELGITKYSMYQGLISKGTYTRLENGETPLPLQDLIKFSDRLGIRIPELLYKTNVMQRSSNDFGKERVLLANRIQDPENIPELYLKYENKRNKHIQYLSLFIYVNAVIATESVQGYPNFESTYLQEVLDYYKSRTIFYGIDYEILTNLVVFISTSKLQPIINKLYPVKNADADVKDFCCQLATFNSIDYSFARNEFEFIPFFQEQFDELRKNERINLSIDINLRELFLRQIILLKTNPAKADQSYMKFLIRTANDMGTLTAKRYMEELLEITQKNDSYIKTTSETVTDIR
jgi:Helix-turn-helix.